MSEWTMTNDTTLEIFPCDTGKTLAAEYYPQYDSFEFRLTESGECASEPTTTSMVLSGRNLQVLMEFMFRECKKEGWWLAQDGNEWWERQKAQNKRNEETRDR
jgi:hypothetical protein